MSRLERSRLSSRTYSVEEVRQSFGERKRWEEMSGELPALLIFRPLSFILTPPFLRLGWSAVTITLVSGIAAAAMLVAALRGGPTAYVWVVGFGFTYQLLDCIDGNVARVTGTSSALGTFLDLLVGQIYWVLLFISIGLLVEERGGGVLGRYAIPFSLALPLFVQLHRICRNYAQLHFSRDQFGDERPQGPLSKSMLFIVALAGLENLYVFAVLIGGIFGALDWVLVGIAIYVVGVFLYAEIELLADLWDR